MILVSFFKSRRTFTKKDYQLYIYDEVKEIHRTSIFASSLFLCLLKILPGSFASGLVKKFVDITRINDPYRFNRLGMDGAHVDGRIAHKASSLPVLRMVSWRCEALQNI